MTRIPLTLTVFAVSIGVALLAAFAVSITPPPPPTFLSLAHAQASPSVAIDLSSTSVTEGTAITVTMSFSNLAEDSDRATTDYLFRADVLDADGCEEQAGGYGLGVDRKINLVDEDPEIRRGTISAGCPAGDYTVRASISDSNGGELASATADFSVAAPEPPASTDARLSSLVLSGVTLEFDPDTTTYAAEVGNDLAETTVTPTVNDDGATYAVRLDGADDDDGIIPLGVGGNVISVLVTAEDRETTRTYTVTVTRAEAPPERSTDATLSSLALSGVTLEFDPATTTYAAEVGNDLAETTVAPTVNDDGATYAVRLDGAADDDGTVPLAVGENAISVVVTAEDGETTRTYTVTITRAEAPPELSDDATLKDLTLSGVTLGFDPATTTYVGEVGNDLAETTVTPTVNDDGATYAVRLDGADDDDGIIPLGVGGNVISVLVTAEDRETTRTYTVTVTRAEAPTSGPTVSISLFPVAVIGGEGDEIAVTMSFGNLTFDSDRATTDYTFRADVKDSKDGDTDGCENQAGGCGLGVDRKINLVDEDPEVRRGAISADCPAGVYTLRASISNADNEKLASATAEFYVLPPPTAVVVDGPEEEEPRVARQTAGSTLTVVWTPTADPTNTYQVSWTDGETCASTERYYAYALVGGVIAYEFAIGDVAVSENTVTATLGLLGIGNVGQTIHTVTVTCGNFKVSGHRVVASVELTGTTGGTYYFPAPSSALSGLTVGGVSAPGFAADTTAYTMTVDNDLERATVAATVAAAGSSYEVTAPADADVVTDGHQVDLAVGVNPVITVVVTAVDDTTTTYTITVTRRAPTAMTVVWREDGSPNQNFQLTWTDGGTCASGTNYYAYAEATPFLVLVSIEIGNVASTENTLTATIEYQYWAGDYPSEVVLYCGSKGASGSRLVARVAVSGFESGTFRTPTPALSALSLTGVSDADLGFQKTDLDYDVTVGNDVESTTVAATVDREGDTFVVNLGGAEDDDRVIPLSPGDNVITVVVSAEDGSVSTTYTITVTREVPLPTVTISADETEADEGDALSFTVTRTGATDAQLPVTVNVTETRDLVPTADEGMRTETIPIGEPSKKFTVRTADDDETWDPHSTVTATVQANDAYTVGSQSEDQTMVKDDDFPMAKAVLSVGPNPVSEDAGKVVATITVTTDFDQEPHRDSPATLTLTTSADTANGGADYSILSETDIGFAADTFTRVDIGGGVMSYRAELTYDIAITDDGVFEQDETFRVSLGRSPGANPISVDQASTPQTVTIIGSNTLTVVGTQPDPNITRYTFAISWVDGFSCASGTNYYAYFHLFYKHTSGIGWRDLENVASSANTMSVTHTDVSFNPELRHPNIDASLVLYCGERDSGREVGRVDVTDAVGTFIFPSTDSTLSALSVGGVPAPGFAPATTEYSMTVDNNVARTTVTPTLNHATASFEVTPEDADPDTDGHQVDLAVGANVITAVVTAQDDSTTTYTVTVTRVPSTDASLRRLSFSRIADFQFVPGTLTYNVTPVVNLQSTTVAAATTHAGASYVVKLGGVEDADRVIELAEGENVITVVVTAQDKMATRTYTVTVDNPAFIPGAFPVITSLDGDEDVSGPFTVRFTFLKAANRVEAMPVTGFALGDIGVTNGVASDLVKAHGTDAYDRAIWEATITPDTYGTPVVVSLAADVVPEGNQAASLSVTTRVDDEAPTVTLRANVVYFESGEQSSVITRPTGLHIKFNERVKGLEINDFEVTNGEIGYLDVDADGNGHAVLVPKVSDSSHITVRLKTNAVRDLAGNRSAATQVVLHASPDDTPPEIVGFKQRLRRVDDDGTHVWALTFVFSEPVKGFTANDVAISGGTKSTESRANHEYGTRWAIDIESDGGQTPITVSVAAGRFSDGNNTNTAAFIGKIGRSE